MDEEFDNSESIATEAKPEAINASCRGPVLFLFASAALWLVDAALAGVLGSFKVHVPGFLADYSFLTYGRLQANAWVAFLFGFGGNAGLGLTLWMLSRLRGMPLARPGFVIAGTVLWNVGVTAAMVGISLGDQSGVAGLELPKYASRVLLIGQAFIAFSAILTYFSRRHRQLYPSTWYLIASLVALPWVLGTAHWLLVETPVRGAAQIPVGHWATTSLVQIWLGCMGLAAVIYFIPKIIGRELFSRQWAALGFWMLLLLGGWVNLNSGAPLPVWQIVLSQYASGLFIFVVIAVGWNLRQTAKGVPLLGSQDLTLKCMGFALGAWIVSGLFTFSNVCPSWNAIMQFTYANTALRNFFAWGFFAMAMIGAILYVAPRLLGPKVAWACAKTNKWVYRLIAIGAVIMVTAGVGMSWKHGKSLNAILVDELPAGQLVVYSVKVEESGDSFAPRSLSEIRSLHAAGNLKSKQVQRKITKTGGDSKPVEDEISLSDLPGYDAWPAVAQKRALMPMRITFLGELMFLGGSLIFLCSMLCLLVNNCCGECSPMSLWRQFRETPAKGGAK
jgi:cytochrome c oxidase cbb3-type subunit 1